YGVRRLASALIGRQLAVADDTLNGKVTVSCRKESAIASYRKRQRRQAAALHKKVTASCRTRNG
ncbi:MAG: hypothetical protein ACUVQG_13165, partial [Thermogutta sp.]